MIGIHLSHASSEASSIGQTVLGSPD